MVTASAGIQTDLSQVVHSSCRSVCHSPEPKSSTVRVSSPRPKGLGHRCSEHKLDGSHCLCLPSDGSPLQDALVLGPSAALNRDPTATSSVNNPAQTVPQLCVSQQSSTSQPPRLVSRSNSSKNKASLWRWQRELLPLRGHQQGPSTS